MENEIRKLMKGIIRQMNDTKKDKTIIDEITESPRLIVERTDQSGNKDFFIIDDLAELIDGMETELE